MKRAMRRDLRVRPPSSLLRLRLNLSVAGATVGLGAGLASFYVGMVLYYAGPIFGYWPRAGELNVLGVTCLWAFAGLVGAELGSRGGAALARVFARR
jgi:hypothetical protein